MAILVSEFRIHVSRLLRRVERIKNREPFFKMLYLEANKQFLRFDSEAWAKDDLDIELIHYFEAFEECEDNPVHMLILYILISMRLEDIAHYNLNIISVLAGILEINKVPVSCFSKYLSMILYEPIHNCLSSLSESEQFFAMMEIIDTVPFEDVKQEKYRKALDVLDRYGETFDSPMFNGDYTLKNIYDVLSKLIANPLSKDYFSDKDRQILERIVELEKVISAVEKTDLMRRFAIIEETNARNPIQMVRIMLNVIQNFHCYKQYGIDIPLDDNPIKI